MKIRAIHDVDLDNAPIVRFDWDSKDPDMDRVLMAVCRELERWTYHHWQHKHEILALLSAFIEAHQDSE